MLKCTWPPYFLHNIIFWQCLSYLWLCLSTLLLLVQRLSLSFSLWMYDNTDTMGHLIIIISLANSDIRQIWHIWQLLIALFDTLFSDVTAYIVNTASIDNLNTLSATTKRFMNMIYWLFVQQILYFLAKQMWWTQTIENK